MTPFISGVTNLFSAGLVVIQVITVLIIASLVVKVPVRKNKKDAPKGFAALAFYAGKYGLEAGLVMSIVSALTSLFYSSIAGFEPCEFCWWARILFFPQIVILGTALYYRNKYKISDRAALMTGLIMSVIGALIMAFQYYSQMFDPSLLEACVANGASCTKLYFVTFGYITIPMMALTGFIFMIAILVARLRFIKAE